MRTQLQQEKLIDDITWKCFESVSIADFSEKALPLLNQLLDTSMSLVVQGSEGGVPIPVAGSLKEILPNYHKEWMADDPIQEALQRRKPRLQRAALLPEWQEYQKTTVYHEFAKPNEVNDFYHLMLGGGNYSGPGMGIIMLSRSLKQPEFEEQDALNLARFLPALESMVQRDALLQSRYYTLHLVEAMVELQSPVALAFSLKGSLLWASPKAEEILELGRKGKTGLLEELLGVVAQFRELHGGKGLKAPPPTKVSFVLKDAEMTRAQLRLMRTRSGEPFLMAEFDPPLFSPHLDRLSSRHELTISEAKVLGLIAQGMSNLDIANYLCVSLATVRTHVSRVLSKLGVTSRVQAALLAHGHRVFPEEN